MKTLFLLGPAGSFSDIAADRLKKSFRKNYCFSFREIFRKTAGPSRSEAKQLMRLKGATFRQGFGFLPVKNKIIGELRFVTRELKSQRRKYEVISHICFPIRLVLMAQEKIDVPNIKFLYMSTLMRKQCGKFLKKYFKHAKKITSAKSSSSVIKKIAQLKGKKASQSAAIGSEKAAKLFDLKVLKRNIQDDPRDWTEFVVFKNRDL